MSHLGLFFHFLSILNKIIVRLKPRSSAVTNDVPAIALLESFKQVKTSTGHTQESTYNYVLKNKLFPDGQLFSFFLEYQL